MTTKFKRGKQGVSISFNELSQGQALALCNAIKSYQTAVGQDVACSLINALNRDGKTDQDQQLLDAFS